MKYINQKRRNDNKKDYKYLHFYKIIFNERVGTCHVRLLLSKSNKICQVLECFRYQSQEVKSLATLQGGWPEHFNLDDKKTKITQTKDENTKQESIPNTKANTSKLYITNSAFNLSFKKKRKLGTNKTRHSKSHNNDKIL